MRATAIQIVDLSPKWGLVTVMAPDTSIVRQYQISGAEVAAVLAGGKPPGCTDDEWLSGQVIVGGRPCLPGMAVVGAEGWLTVNFGITESAGRIAASIMQIPADEWALIDGAVHVVGHVADQMGF